MALSGAPSALPQVIAEAPLYADSLFDSFTLTSTPLIWKKLTALWTHCLKRAPKPYRHMAAIGRERYTPGATRLANGLIAEKAKWIGEG